MTTEDWKQQKIDGEKVQDGAENAQRTFLCLQLY